MPVPGVRPGAIKSAEAKPAPSLKNLPTAPVRTQAPRNIVATRQNPAFGPVIGTKGKLISSKATRPGLPVKPSGHALFSLHTLSEAAGDVGKTVEGAFHQTYGQANKKGKAETGREVRFPGAAIAAPVRTGELTHKLIKGAENLPKNTAQTAVGLGEAIPAIGQASVEGLEGKPRNLVKVGKGMAVGTANMLLHPAREWEKNPAQMLLLAGGAEATVGGLTRKAMAAAPSDVLKTAASRARPDLQLLPNVARKREYSASVFRMGAQKAADKFRRDVLNQDPNVATGSRLHRELYGGGVLGQKIQQFTGLPVQGMFKPGRVDLHAGNFQVLRKMYRNNVDHLFRTHQKMMKLGKSAREAVPHIYEGTVRHPNTIEADLTKRLGMLKDEAKHLREPGNIRSNKETVKSIEGILGDKQFLAHPEPAFATAADLAATHAQLAHQLVGLGVLEPHQLNAAHIPYGIMHHDLGLNQEPGMHPMMGVARAARRATKGAEGALAKAIQARDRAKAEHPPVPAGHPVAKTRQALKEAELGKANIEGKLWGSGLRSLGRQAGLDQARQAYSEAKNAHREEMQNNVTAARERLADIASASAKAHRDLSHAIRAGHIQRNGHMWPQLEDKNGKVVTYEQLREMAEKDLGRPVGFLTHKPPEQATYGKAGYSTGAARRGIQTKRRTGGSYRAGLYDSSWQGLHRQFYETAGKLAHHQSFNQAMDHFSAGAWNTSQKAEQQAAHLTEATGTQWVARTRGPEKLLEKGLMADNQISPLLAQFGVVEHKIINDMNPHGQYVVLPKSVSDRLEEHDRISHPGKFEKVLQSLVNKFRSAALFATPRWPVGTTQENMIRLAFAGINPFAAFGVGHAVKVGHAIMDANGLLGGNDFRAIMADPRMNPAQKLAARTNLAAVNAGMHFGSYMNNSIRRDVLDQMDSASRAHVEDFNNASRISVLIKGWAGWKNFVGHGLTNMESNTKAAMIGKNALREQRKFGSEWRALLKRNDEAVRAYAENKLNPDEAAKLTEDMLKQAGNWTHLTPTVRKSIQSWTPFGLWWLNSMKFLFKTLPVDHPIKTAALTALVIATKSEEVKPTFLEGSYKLHLPIVGTIDLGLLHYSPFDVAKEPVKTAEGMIAPNLWEPLANAAGIDPLTLKQQSTFGEWPHNIARAALKIPEEYIPLARPAMTVFGKQGGKEEPKSVLPWATKPGTQRGILPSLEKFVSPFPYTISKQASRGSGLERPARERPVRERPARERAPRER